MRMYYFNSHCNLARPNAWTVLGLAQSKLVFIKFPDAKQPGTITFPFKIF